MRFWPALILLVCNASAQAPDTPAAHLLEALLDGSGFVAVKPGEFAMGSQDGNADEQPVHPVRLSRAFEIGKFEVTQAQWEAVMRDPHGRRKPGDSVPAVNPSHFKGPSRPVENVSWDAVQQFLQRLNTRDAKHTYRLPTEAEWEYAARPWVERESIDRIGWCEANSGGETHRVGEKAADGRGLYDMLGNVRDWVQDWYSADYYVNSPRVDPEGPPSGSYKVYRGGAWLSPEKYCRATSRQFDFPNSGYYSVGFRLVRVPK